MERLGNVHARVRVSQRELQYPNILERIKEMLFRSMARQMEEDFDKLPVTMTHEGADEWTPEEKYQIDLYLVDEKTYRLLDNRFSKDLMERLNQIPITDLMKFVSKYE